MEKLPLLRRAVQGMVILCLGLALASAASQADEVSTGAPATGFVIHGPAETLRDFCHQEYGALWLELPGGARFELITSTFDAQISNPGDGSFHPFDEATVRAALAQVRYPLANVSAEVFLLPYPRRSGLNSVAGSRLILLSPGVLPIAVAQQYAEFVHELGHVVQYARMPDADEPGWTRYRQMRGISDCATYCAEAPHADRPHEIFAEDFRALFGGALANYSGSIENGSLAMPQRVAGLEPFLMDLSGVALTSGLEAFPNPSPGAVSFRGGGGSVAVIDLFDLAGRRIATLSPALGSSGPSWHWDRVDAQGARLGAGVVLARVRGSSAPAVRVTLLR